MNNSTIALRMARQHLMGPANRADYDALFRAMSPVQTEYWSMPGIAPSLAHRAGFDDADYNDGRRANREILKGRFMGGNIGYVDAEEMELFACAYRREGGLFSSTDIELMQLLRSEGPMNIKLMKRITGMLVKTIAPSLKKLQEAFLVFEDQVDNEWDRAFYLFDREFPELDLNHYSKPQAIAKILPRFIWLNVFATEQGMRSFYRFGAKELNQALGVLLESGKIVEVNDNEQSGYALASDVGAIRDGLGPSSVFALHRNDFLVKSNEQALKRRFSHAQWDVLSYLLIDGAFDGAVLGHFKNGPFVIEDIYLELPEDQKRARKSEIMEAVYMVNSREESPIQRFDGTRP